jgi:hypothetical protein
VAVVEHITQEQAVTAAQVALAHTAQQVLGTELIDITNIMVD